MPQPRASLYVRLSKAADDANTSLDGMVADARALCERRGFREVALHVDDGLSGAVRDRREFIAWMNDARYGRADVLVTPHVDRLTREGLNVAAQILDCVEGKDSVTGKVVYPPVRLIDCHGIDSANGDGFRLTFVIKAEIARAERERIRDRNKAKARRLRLAGRWPGGAAPYGYTVVDASDGVGKTLVINDVEADAIRDVASRILAGESLTGAVRHLNTHGPAPRRAATWSRVTLGRLLTGEQLLGRLTLGGVVQRDADGRAMTPFPAVLDLPTRNALRAALSPKARAPHRGRVPSRLLSTLIACASCGARLYVHRPGARMIMYRCPTRRQGGICHAPVAGTAHLIDDFVTREFLTGAGHLPMVERRVIVADDGNLAAVEEALAAALADLGTAVTPERVARLQSLQAERDALAKAPSDPQVELIDTGRTLADEWERRDLDGRRSLLADAFEVIALHPGGRYRKGLDPSRVQLVWAEGTHDPDFD